MSANKNPKREDVLQKVINRIIALPNGRILRVGIDGVDGAGKTTFADEITAILSARGKSVIRASVDGFHNPKSFRYRQGRTSPEGFFRDSYNYDALKEALLDPLSVGGSCRFRRVAFDHFTDSALAAPEEMAQKDSILIFDGIFLHRPELRAYWDFSVYLDVDFQVSIPRGALRGPGFGSPNPEAVENQRYIEGQKLYFRECEPKKHASIIINNNELDYPQIVGFKANSKK